MKIKNPDLPDGDSERYRGKPLLLILESYVLDCIGHLSEERAQLTGEWVQQAFDGDADWKETLRGQLRLAETLDGTLREMWRRKQRIAQATKIPLSPEAFAQMVVDENFADLIRPSDPPRGE